MHHDPFQLGSSSQFRVQGSRVSGGRSTVQSCFGRDPLNKEVLGVGLWVQ